MDNKLPGYFKRGLRKTSKRFKAFTHGKDLADHIERPPSVPPNVLQESMQQSGASLLVQTATMGGRESVTPPPTAVTHELTKSLLAQNIKGAVKGTLWALSSAAEGIPIPGAKAIFDAIIKVIEVIETTKANQEGFKALENRCQELMDTVFRPLEHKQISEIPSALKASLDRLQSNLDGILADIEQKLKSNHLNQVLSHEEHSAMIKSMDIQITQFLELYSTKIETWTMLMIHQVHQTQTLEKLPYVNAGYDHISGQERSSCFSGTRQNLLTEIKTWIHDSNMDKPIYVLYGIAGIGKSTVAQTVAEYAASNNLLGASFFFSRAEEERRSGDQFFSTLAFQLAQYDVNLGAWIASTLFSIPDAPQKALALQLKHLIIEPIQKAKLSQRPIILVIDAFDECQPSHAKHILTLLASNISSIPNFKVFLTTRPELHIQKVLKAKTHLEPFYLHEIEKSVAKEDIKVFLEHALSHEQVSKMLQVDMEWEPTNEDLMALVERCGILFIMASTAVKYILNENLNNPDLQMMRLLKGLDIKHGKNGVIGSLDDMYLGILRAALPEIDTDEFVLKFQKVVGAIVVLEDLLPMVSLSSLLGMKISEVQTTLQNLHSIMAPVSSNQAPQLYHKSFPDFITDNARCTDGNFYIVPEDHHAQLAELCFSVMKKNLHANMPGLQGLQKYISNTEMGENRTKNITGELRYACMYWAAHLSKAGDNETEKLCKLLHAFSFSHLLHWIEVLSLIGKLEVAYPAMNLAQKVLAGWKVQKHQDLNDILNDGCRCVNKFYEIVKASASHIYYSAFPFMPSESKAYNAYKSAITDSVIIVKGQEIQWNPLLVTLYGHSSRVWTIAFSPDGSRLASGSDDNTVRLWDGVTGAHTATLEGHSDSIYNVAFSPDGSRLASGSPDSTVRLWDGVTGAHIATLEGHSGGVQTVAFSPDGTRLASSSNDNTVRLWDGVTGAYSATLGGHSDGVCTVVFSPDGSKLASGSSDTTVRIWDGVTGTLTATLKGHSHSAWTVTFSSDGSRLASGSFDKTVRLWDGVTGAHTATLEGHSDLVWTVAFSPDGTRLASSSDDKSIRLWDGVTGAPIATMEEYSKTVALSTDGSSLISQDLDGAINHQNASPGIAVPISNHNLDSVTFSNLPYRYIASDGTITHATSDIPVMFLSPVVSGSVCHAIKGDVLALGDRKGHVYLLQLSQLLGFFVV